MSVRLLCIFCVASRDHGLSTNICAIPIPGQAKIEIEAQTTDLTTKKKNTYNKDDGCARSNTTDKNMGQLD